MFTDLVMPGGMNGWQLAETIREEHPGMPVLFTSGYTRESVLRYIALDQPVPFVNKPYRKARIAQQIRELLDA